MSSSRMPLPRMFDRLMTYFPNAAMLLMQDRATYRIEQPSTLHQAHSFFLESDMFSTFSARQSDQLGRSYEATGADA